MPRTPAQSDPHLLQPAAQLQQQSFQAHRLHDEAQKIFSDASSAIAAVPGGQAQSEFEARDTPPVQLMGAALRRLFRPRS